ncbi:Na+/H+ antiporter [bacterium]|nr:MAG: Na+/H+ antiporter [bacterium]
MQESVLLFGLLLAIIAVVLIAKRLSLPYPIAFVIGGLLLALVPDLPAVDIQPDVIFLLVLPPLLYMGGWTTDWREFRANLRPISLLAVGLVVATTVIVAVVAHHVIPSFPWAAAFALGAIVSPPDAVAASAIFERFPIPRRIAAVLEGEGLVNDASALVIYRFAVAAALTGAFSLTRAGAAFVAVAAGGIAVGLLVAVAIDWLLSWLEKTASSDSLIDNVIYLVAPYAAYLPAESLHVSGVLAAVVAGIYAGRRVSGHSSPESRLTGSAVWNLLAYVMNGLVFLLIGLHLREIVHDPTFTMRAVAVGAIISVVVIAVRIAWVYPATYLPRLLFRPLSRNDPAPSWRYVFIISWAGMRGIVSLAAALALPLNDELGRPFPGRSEIIFVVFCVILATLVFQGLTLSPLIRLLGIDAGEGPERREIEVRIAALEGALAHLTSLERRFTTTDERLVAGRLKAEYESRIEHLHRHLHGEQPESPVVRNDHWLQGEALAAERSAILRLRDAGEIPDEIFRRVQYDLDLAQARLR